MNRVAQFPPMLAKEYDPNKTTFPVYTQPKLDGVRCVAMWHNSRLVMLSRSGARLKIPHLAKQLKKWLAKDEIADGELYVHGLGINKISGMVRRGDPGLQFHVFDMVRKLKKRTPYVERLGLIATAYDCGDIKLVRHQVALNADDLEEFHREYVAAGYEGLILRAHDAWYTPGYTTALQKIKAFRDSEFRVVDCTVATGEHAGAIIFECMGNGDDTFTVVPADTLENRRAMADHAEDFVGLAYKVKYFEMTKAGKPRFPVGLGFRSENDM
jgi:DNA ligase-1